MASVKAAEYVAFKAEGIWRYFLRLKVNDQFGNKAKCTECNKVYACTGGSTKGLHDHVLSMHAIDVRARKWPAEAVDTPTSPSNASSSSSQIPEKMSRGPRGPISKFILPNIEKSLQASMARMVVCDGLPFRVFITSPDIRKGLEAQGFSPLPKSPETVKKMVMEHGEAIRAVVCQEIADLKNAGTRFSLTFDEWTSTRNRRYMNVNVNAAGRQIWNLGMVRVIGTMPAEKCVQLLESKLSNFGLSLTDDIVAICTDGASVMKKVGSLIAAEQQLCYAHAIQLAVLDVLYKGNDKSASDQEPQCNNTERESDLSDDEDDDESQSAESQDFNFIDDTNLIAELSDNYDQLVEKVRKIVKIFRRSPTKNDDVLQKYIKAEVGHELSLSLDCKTRWNSMFEMLHRFVSVRNCILKAMIDIKSSVQLSDTDMDDIQDIVSALEPVKLTVEALCRREINLVSGDAVIRFAVVTLEKQRSELAKTLAAAIRLRIKERRNEFARVLIYLNNPKATSSDDTFDIPKPATIRKIIATYSYV
jgi:hypothetical protein